MGQHEAKGSTSAPTSILIKHPLGLSEKEGNIYLSIIQVVFGSDRGRVAFAVCFGSSLNSTLMSHSISCAEVRQSEQKLRPHVFQNSVTHCASVKQTKKKRLRI